MDEVDDFMQRRWCDIGRLIDLYALNTDRGWFTSIHPEGEIYERRRASIIEFWEDQKRSDDRRQ